MQIPSNCHVNIQIITKLESTSIFPLTPSAHWAFVFQKDTEICAHICKQMHIKLTNYFPCSASNKVAVNKWETSQRTLQCHWLTFGIHTL